MNYIADFHIHSRYSYATSKHMDLLALATWGQLKGIKVMGTGDFTHPFWQAELQEYLEPAEQGLFKIASKYQSTLDDRVYETCKSIQRFLLSAEISTIFKRNGRCYKVHSLLLAPSFKEVFAISKKLEKIGNIASDGRPILGLDVKDLLKIVLDASPECMLIPAHIWTPHFGLLGSKSGFNSIEECFEELTEHIYALETGLSSNLLMNAHISELDKFSLLSNSDAHSVQKLGREANMMNTDLSYEGITKALKTNDPKQLVAGIEFFPEKGKYYGDGHRNCNIYMTPEQTMKNNKCLRCEKPLTIGVAHRVKELADRTEKQAMKYVKKSFQVIPLQDIIAHNLGFAATSKRVQTMYQQMLAGIGNEFFILLDASIEDIEKYSNISIATSIQRLRVGDVQVTPGYDGVYGTVNF